MKLILFIFFVCSGDAADPEPAEEAAVRGGGVRGAVHGLPSAPVLQSQRHHQGRQDRRHHEQGQLLPQAAAARRQQQPTTR